MECTLVLLQLMKKQKKLNRRIIKPIKPIDMKSRELKKIIASDKHNILRDDETRIGYFLLRIKYKIELLLTKEK